MNREELEQVIYERTRDFVDGRVMDCILELIAEEREACAKVCDEIERGPAMMIEERHTARQCGAGIRKRGKT